jgi:hypothetical protein
MKKIIAIFAFLLVGLVGHSQTNSHLSWMGRVYLGQRAIPVSSVRIEVFELDTFRNALIPINPIMYMVDYTIQNGMVYSVRFDETRYFQTRPFVIKATPNPGTVLFNCMPTYYPSSLSLGSARPFFCMLGGVSIMRDFQMLKSSLMGPRFFTD